MEFEKRLEKIIISLYYDDKSNADNIIFFVKGYLLSKEGEDFIKDISAYLNISYKIDIQFNTWKEQIDHYAFLMNESWGKGFYKLLYEIKENAYKPLSDFEKKEKIEINTNQPEYKAKGKSQDSIILNDGHKLMVGDWIQLTDKIGDDYKKTKFFDASLKDPSWELFHPSEKDFNYIHFYYEMPDNQNIISFSRARYLLSNSIVQIKTITLEENKTIIYTDFFRIEANQAFENQEIVACNNEKFIETNFSNLDFLLEDIINHQQGFIPRSFDEMISYWCFTHLRYLKKEWHLFDRDINGKWYRNKNSQFFAK